MGNLLNALVLHVTAGAIVGWSLCQSRSERQRAAFLRVAREAFVSIVGRNFPRGRLLVWIVAGDAEQPTAAFHIALTQRFGHEVLEQRVAGRFTAANRQDEYSERVGQRCPGPA